MKFFSTILCLIVTSLYLKAADASVFWRLLADGTVRIQVQQWKGVDAPELELYTLLDPNKRYPVPALTPMSVKGVYQLDTWLPEGLPEALYKVAIKGVEEPLPLSPLAQESNFQAIKGALHHKDQTVTWRQSAPGAVRLLFQMPSGLTLAASEKWQVFGAGTHQLDWTAVSSELGAYRYHPSLMATIQVAPFQRDILVIGSPSLDQSGLPESSLHCQIQLQKNQSSGKTLLKVELTPATLKSIGTKRFEILIYVDGLFIHEESQGVSPYTFILPESLEMDAQSTLTVNIIDYLGNWGVASLSIGEN